MRRVDTRDVLSALGMAAFVEAAELRREEIRRGDLDPALDRLPSPIALSLRFWHEETDPGQALRDLVFVVEASLRLGLVLLLSERAANRNPVAAMKAVGRFLAGKAGLESVRAAFRLTTARTGGESLFPGVRALVEETLLPFVEEALKHPSADRSYAALRRHCDGDGNLASPAAARMVVAWRPRMAPLEASLAAFAEVALVVACRRGDVEVLAGNRLEPSAWNGPPRLRAEAGRLIGSGAEVVAVAGGRCVPLRIPRAFEDDAEWKPVSGGEPPENVFAFPARPVAVPAAEPDAEVARPGIAELPEVLPPKGPLDVAAIAEFQLRDEPDVDGVWLYTAVARRRSVQMACLDLHPIRGFVRYTGGDGLLRKGATRHLSLDDLLAFLGKLFGACDEYMRTRVASSEKGLIPLTVSVTGLSWFSGSYSASGLPGPRDVEVPDLFHSEQRSHPLRRAWQAGRLREALLGGL